MRGIGSSDPLRTNPLAELGCDAVTPVEPVFAAEFVVRPPDRVEDAIERDGHDTQADQGLRGQLASTGMRLEDLLVELGQGVVFPEETPNEPGAQSIPRSRFNRAMEAYGRTQADHDDGEDVSEFLAVA